MKAWVSIIAAVVFLASFAPLASAQDGMPTAGVTQVHGEGWDWGYVGLSPIFGFSLGDRFSFDDETRDISTNPIFGGKAALGVGSNVDGLGTEFFFTFVNYSYTITELTPTGETERTTGMAFGKLGFNMMYEFLSNESITDEGQVLKDGSPALTGFAGLYWLTFMGDGFDPGDAREDGSVQDETLWYRIGVAVEIPFSNAVSLAFHGSIDGYLYHWARIIDGFGEIDEGDTSFETFTEKVQITLGGRIQFHPFLVTSEGHHWRFFVGANFIMIESPQPHQLLFSAGVNFGW